MKYYNYDIISSLKLHWKNAFNFHGKTSRTDFWIPFFLQLIPVFTANGLVYNWAIYSITVKVLIIILYLYIFLSILPFVSSMIRRLHDTGNRSLLMLSLLVSPLSHILLMCICCMKSSNNTIPSITIKWNKFTRLHDRSIRKEIISSISMIFPFIYSMYLLYAIIQNQQNVKHTIDYAVYLFTQIYLVLQVFTWTQFGNITTYPKLLKKIYNFGKRIIIYPYVTIIFAKFKNGSGDVPSLAYGIFFTALLFYQVGKEIYDLPIKRKSRKP